MNIDGLNLDHNIDNLKQSDILPKDISNDLSMGVDKSAKENEKFADYLAPSDKKVSNKQEDIKTLEKENELVNIPGSIEVNYLKNIQDIAVNDKVSSKRKIHSDLNALMHFKGLKDKIEKTDRNKFNLDSLSDGDFKLLIHGLQDKSTVIQGINNINFQNQQINCAITNETGQISYKSIDVSKGVADLIEKAYKTLMPVRLDFDGNSSVILRVAQDGKLSAEFQSSNKAMEDILKNNLPALRSKLDAEGISYRTIFLKDSPKRQNNREQNGG